MNHEKYKQWMILENYNELSEKHVIELREHLDVCENCRKEFLSLNNDLEKFSKEFKFKNEDRILNEARKDLRQLIVEKKYTAVSKKRDNGLFSFIFQPKLRLAFGGVAIFFLGFILSFLLLNNSNENPLLPENNVKNISYLNEDGMRLNNIHFVYTDNNTGDIRVTFEAVKPVTVMGNIKDKNIQNILMYSMLEEKNPGTRLNTINFIKNESNNTIDEEVKQTIITVVKYDKNPGVRMEALKLLNSFQLSKDVKDALIYVVMNDDNSAMRIGAINKLAEATNNGLLLHNKDKYQLKRKLTLDNNNYVKLIVKKVLEGN